MKDGDVENFRGGAKTGPMRQVTKAAVARRGSTVSPSEETRWIGSGDMIDPGCRETGRVRYNFKDAPSFLASHWSREYIRVRPMREIELTL